MRKDIILCLFTFCILYTCWLLTYLHTSLQQQHRRGSYSSPTDKDGGEEHPKLGGEEARSETTAREGAQLILLWTTLDGDMRNWEKHFGPEWSNNCDDASSFAVTSNRSRLSESSLVIFNLNDLKTEQFTDRLSWAEAVLPSERLPRQRWALFWREPPGRVLVSGERLRWMDGVFNWTISYRRDSDVFYPFGFFNEVERKEASRKGMRSRKGLAWYSNDHCETPSRREDLARALEALNINGSSSSSSSSFVTQLYGKCVGNMPKLKMGQSFLKASRRKIKFYLAAEEEICEDYITDIYFSSLHHSFVPVVLGGSDLGYDEVGLAGTYIDALDFASEKELVNYLRLLTFEYRDEFLQYLAWQDDYELLPATRWVCDLHRALSEDRQPDEAIEDFSEFWHRKKCYGSYLEANFHPETN